MRTILCERTFHITEMSELSWCQNCCHWCHHRLSLILCVETGSGNGLVLSDNKPLPGPMLTQTDDNLWCHQWWQSWNYNNFQFSVITDFFKRIQPLTHWGHNKMATVLQTTFANTFSLMKTFVYWFIQTSLKFIHWGSIDNRPTQVQVKAWHPVGA